MLSELLPLPLLVLALGGCLWTARRFQRARRAAICDRAARDGLLACYALIRDGRREEFYHRAVPDQGQGPAHSADGG